MRPTPPLPPSPSPPPPRCVIAATDASGALDGARSVATFECADAVDPTLPGLGPAASQEEEEDPYDAYTITSDVVSALPPPNVSLDIASVVANVSVEVTVTVLVTKPPTIGGGAGDSGILTELLPSKSEQTCRRGCCTSGKCVCDPGARGAHCEASLQCGVTQDLRANSSWDVGVCAAIAVAGEVNATTMLTCVCSSVGYVAVLRRRLRPVTLLDSIDGSWAGKLGSKLAARPGWVIVPLLLYALLALLAFAKDQRLVYTRQMPEWADPASRVKVCGRTSRLVKVASLYMRTRHKLLMLGCGVPGLSRYSALQQLHMVCMTLVFRSTCIQKRCHQCRTRHQCNTHHQCSHLVSLVTLLSLPW